MPYKNPEDRRRYDRERKRRLRAANVKEPTALELLSRRAEVTDGLMALLGEAIVRVRRDPKARDIDKGREIGRLVTVALRVVETRDLTDRLEAMERVVEVRRAG